MLIPDEIICPEFETLPCIVEHRNKIQRLAELNVQEIFIGYLSEIEETEQLTLRDWFNSLKCYLWEEVERC